MDKDLEIAERSFEEQERTSVLANERTYAAWIRTGLASLVGGIAMEKLLFEIIPPFTNRIIGTVLVGCSGLFFLLASWRYYKVGMRMKSAGTAGAPIVLLVIISIFLMIISVVAILGIWRSL